MGSYNGAEVSKLIGLFILHQLFQLVGVKNIGLYWDDGLAILENASGPTSKRIKKKDHQAIPLALLKHHSRNQARPKQFPRCYL